MLMDIIKKEIMETISSPKFVFTFLLCAVLILLSVYTGIKNYEAELREYNAGVALNKNNLENQQSWTALAGLGTKITKPPQVLGTIVSGIQESVGRVATVNIAYDPRLTDSKYSSNPVFSIFGTLDLSFIVKIVLSLFAILFTFDAIVGEKERGTLKLTLSNPVPRDKIILGKMIGGFISLMMPLIIPLLLGLMLITMYPGVSFSGDDWARVGIIFLLYLLYLSVFFTLGIFVSAQTQQSSTSFLILLFIWVTFVMIIPKASVMISGQFYPIPSIHEITAQKDAFLQEIQGGAAGEIANWREENPPDRENPEAWQESFRQYIEDFQQDATKRIDDYNGKIELDYQNKKDTQRDFAIMISRVSPASALMFGSMSLAKTGINEHDSFLASIKPTYKREFTEWANTNMMQNINMQTGESAKPDLTGMPQHQFTSESLNQSVKRAIPDFVIMLVFILIFFVGAYVSFLRYDVR